MKNFKSKVLASLLTLALVMTSVISPSVSVEAASKKAVKTVTLKVSGKKVNKKTKTLTVGKSLTVKTTVSPSSAKKSISYKSSNKKIATVSSKGKVKAKKPGTAKITVTVKGKNNKKKTAWFKVKVVKKATPTKKPTKKPTATVAPTKKPTATVAPTAEATATVAPTAEATATAAPTAEATATVAPTAEATATAAPTAVATATATVAPTAEATATAAPTAEATATAAPTAVATATATVAPTAAATATATVAPTKKPTATVAPTAVATATAAPTATVAPTVEVTGINLTASAETIEKGQTAQLRVEFTPEDATDKTVTFTSSDEKVATVDEKGVVTAVENGQVTITATTANGIKATVDIKVAKVMPTKLELNVNSLDLTVGDSHVLAAVFTPADATVSGVTWTSKDETVAQVDATGKVTAIGKGSTKIIAKSVANESLVAECSVNVKEKTSDKTDGITISVANSLADYENTVFTGNNADVKVRVYKDGKPVGNTDVTLKMEYKSGTGNYWYISNNQSQISTVKTDDLGIASFTVSLRNGMKYDATDGVMGGYLLTATATGASTTEQAPLTFARFTVGSANGRVNTSSYSFSNITVNKILTNLVQGVNASNEGLSETQTIERKIIDVDNVDENKLIGTSQYVVSQMRSTTGTNDHAVTFNAAPLIEYPEVITGTTDDDYKQKVEYVSDGYSVYDTTESTIIKEVPTNLNYATLNFANVTISKNTALKIEVYDAYDELTGIYGTVLARYAIKGEHVEENFTFQIPIQDLAKIAGDYVYIKVYVQSEGQIEVDKAVGFSLVNITGNYIGTSKYKNISEIYKDATIEWKQVKKGEIGQDAYLYASYQSKVTMTADEAEKYGILTKNPGDAYYNAKVEYKVPTYPHIGNAYVTVKKPNSQEKPAYFMIPTEVVNNENKLISSKKVQAFEVTEEEATQYGETAVVTSDESTVTINSEKSGVTEVYGFLTVPELDYLTLEERRLFAYVEWAPLPTEEQKNITDFYALVGQTITVDVLVTDGQNKQSDKEVEFYLGDDKGEKLTREDLPEGVEILTDATIFDDNKSIIKTDKDGMAHITFKSTSFEKGIIDKPLFVKCEGYETTMSVAGTEAEYARLYWIAPGLSFTDQTAVSDDEVKGNDEYKEGQKATTTISYELDNTDAVATEQQKKNIATTWLIGYKVVGLVNDGMYTDAKSAAAAGYSNVIITGAETDITLNPSGAGEVLGETVEVDNKNATIKVTSTKTGTDLIRGSISRDSIDEEAVMNFTLLDNAGNVIKTVPNVGKNETSAYVALNIPVKWVPIDMKYEIVTPSGYDFAVDEELLAMLGKKLPATPDEEGTKAKDTIYVKVFDSYGNMLEGEEAYEVTYTVTDSKTGEVVVAETKAMPKKGLVAITYDVPEKSCTYSVTATIEGNKSVTKNINYWVRKETTVDFAMKTASLSSDTKQITIKLTDRVNADTVVKEMFTVVDNIKKEYTVTEVEANGDTLVLTLAEAINPSASYFNVTYNYVKENTDKGQMARRMVSNSQSAVSMIDGFTVTAYNSKEPVIVYEAGVVSNENENVGLPEGAYVVFTYGDEASKLYNVECVKVVDGTATCENAKDAASVIAYIGTASTNAN